MLYVGAPLAALGGSVVANMRAIRAFKAPVSGAWTSFDVELKARYMLHNCLWGHPTEEAGSLGGRAAAATVKVVDASSANDMQALEAQDDAETQMRVVRSLLTPAHLESVENVLVAGCIAFKTAPLAHLNIARFHAAYSSNKHLQLTRLLRAARLQPGIDVLFFINQARNETSDSAASAGAGRANAVSRVSFEVRCLL